MFISVPAGLLAYWAYRHITKVSKQKREESK